MALVATSEAFRRESIAATRLFETAAPAKLAANKLAANKLGPFSAAANSPLASRLAARPIASERIGPRLLTANPETTRDFLPTPQGREVLSYIDGLRAGAEIRRPESSED